MSRAKSGYRESTELGELKRPKSVGVSNSFNPRPLRQSSPLGPIKTQENIQSTRSVLSIIPTLNERADFVVPITLLAKKKVSVNDLSETNCYHLWFRRIKEIFLVMGKQNDTFTRFDMELARADMIRTCEQYLENERPKVGGSDLVCTNDILEKYNILPL